MSKQMLQDAFDFLPEGLSEFLNTPIPEMEAGIWPIDDVDTAIIMQGILAYNLNMILSAFEGLHLIKIFMHIAQHNEVLQMLGGTSLKFLWDEHDFIIIEPNAAVSYAPGENTVSIQITKGADTVESVSCTAYLQSNGTVITMQQDDDPSLYIGDITYQAGVYEIYFVVNFAGRLRSKFVTITVEDSL